MNPEISPLQTKPSRSALRALLAGLLLAIALAFGPPTMAFGAEDSDNVLIVKRVVVSVDSGAPNVTNKINQITGSSPWKHHDIQGLDAPGLEFTSDDPYLISFGIFFDRYEQGKQISDVYIRELIVSTPGTLCGSDIAEEKERLANFPEKEQVSFPMASDVTAKIGSVVFTFPC